MSKIYSHSKISTFEQCPLKFKYRYIDKLTPDIETTIEAFLGNIVHKTLEWVYTEVKNKKLPTIDEIIQYYATRWESRYKPEIVVVKKDLTTKDYFDKGIQFLIGYYTQHQPFDDNTLETEKKIEINLDEDKEYKIQGFIDRLVYNLETGEYEIHDYKTANNLPNKEDIDSNRQLALYSIAIKDLFGHDKEVCLIWHYLAHNQKICSRRTNEQLNQLKQEILEQIKKIEATTKFPPYISKLCDWCEYKPSCPEFGKKKKELDIWVNRNI